MKASPAPVLSTTLTLKAGTWSMVLALARSEPSAPIVTATIWGPRASSLAAIFS